MNRSEDLTLPDWQCEKCNLYSPQTSSALYLWCTICEKIVCALCIGQCNGEAHPWMPASEIIYELKGRIVFTNAEMTKGVSEVVKVLSDVLNERQSNADMRRTQTDEHLPFTSILIQKLRAEIEDNKNLAQETSAIASLFSNLIKQSDGICKDARNLINSFLLEKKLGTERKDDTKIELEVDTLSHKSNVNAFGDNILDDDGYDVTVREVKHEDESMEDSGKTGILDETATITPTNAVAKTASNDGT
ncbi:unnamed protein product [Litomosoides sigmodontis]|uniref:B box-type domain-containing protein n=1 Tax=Litomosoides sigmodontis TaxID=42156 RepID=A0A3P6TG47_LITSI|nr:unnamed protein product [Litomosoides sigmodontis]